MDESRQDYGSVINNCNDSVKNIYRFLVKRLFVILSLAAVCLGVAFGLAAKTLLDISDNVILFIGFPGEILTRFLQMVTAPLIISSVIIKVTSLSAGTSKRIAICTGLYYFFTTLISISTGLILVLLLKPGIYHSDVMIKEDSDVVFSMADALLDLMRNMMPANLLQAHFNKYKTDRLEFQIPSHEPNSTETNSTEVRLFGHFVGGVNIVGLIVSSFIFGLTLKMMEQRGETLLELVGIVNEVTKQLVALIMWYLPIGVLSMMATHELEVDDWDSVFKTGGFVILIFTGLIVHGVIVLPTIYLVVVRRNPWSVIKGVCPALVTAFLTSSSSDTLELTIQCCENRNKNSRRVTRFMLPILSSVNMNGTVLYEVAAAIFIAQLSHISLNFRQIVTIGMTAAITSTGPADIPMTGAVSTFFILTAISVPTQEASMLVAVEWLLEHCNTAVNVLGNCIGVAVVEHLSKKELEEEEDQLRTRASDSAVEEQVQDDEVSPGMLHSL
ncbi:excitatory amino acid transporter 3-like [Labrus mixtus]|uniref:excitatory amino acid transporter 3-like n=1 Tax=Labrus mixtus TaxID=508554 RepID=UPI0029C024B3|nr:excitatory amino acid transporter 3-like [Labrus mixtus]